MKQKIKATNITLTPEISEYLNKRLLGIEKLLSPNDGSVFMEVELGKTTAHHQTGNIFRAEVNLQVSGKLLRAVSEKDDLNTAIDEVREEITRELRSLKGKRFSLLKRGGQRIKNFLRKFYK